MRFELMAFRLSVERSSQAELRALENFRGFGHFIPSKKIKSMDVKKYKCIATEACRSVINPEYFVKEVKSQTGLKVEIIESIEEARLSMKSCSTYISKIKKQGLIFDIGGGSTELSCFNIKPNEIVTKSIML